MVNLRQQPLPVGLPSLAPDYSNSRDLEACISLAGVDDTPATVGVGATLFQRKKEIYKAIGRWPGAVVGEIGATRKRSSSKP